jgi:hypothetical protein
MLAVDLEGGPVSEERADTGRQCGFARLARGDAGCYGERFEHPSSVCHVAHDAVPPGFYSTSSTSLYIVDSARQLESPEIATN